MGAFLKYDMGIKDFLARVWIQQVNACVCVRCRPHNGDLQKSKAGRIKHTVPTCIYHGYKKLI